MLSWSDAKYKGAFLWENPNPDFDPRSFGSWCIKGTDEFLPRVDSSVPLIHHDPSDLGSKIRIDFPKETHPKSPQTNCFR